MTNTNTVEYFVAYAMEQGQLEAAGKVAAGNTFESARVQALMPAINAIEASDIEFTADMGGAITRAYATGAGIDYNAKSETVAISKTNTFFKAASLGLAKGTFAAVDELIRGCNDDKVQKVMRGRAFEKLVTLCRTAVAANAVPGKLALLEVLNPTAAEEGVDEKLAAVFKKLAKLADDAATIGGEKYGALAIESKRYARLQSEHEANAKRNAEHKAKDAAQVVTPTEVTQSSNQEDTSTDDVDALLAA